MTANDPLPIPEAPYRGIESFRFIDQQIFAERDEEVWELQSSITRYRAVLLYGESGTGKSSLINAGFIPAGLKKNLIPDRIRVQPIPGEEFVIERISITSDGKPPYLDSSFVTDDTSPRVVLSVEEFLKRLEPFRRPAGEESSLGDLDDADDLDLTPKPRPILIFDQFEELVTQFEPAGNVSDEAETPEGSAPSPELQKQSSDECQAKKEALERVRETQSKILSALVELIQDDSLRIKILFVFREDYLAKLNTLFERVPDLFDQYLRLLPPGLDVLTRIIRAPFERLPGVFVNRKSDLIGSEISEQLAEQIKEKFVQRSGGGPVNLSELEIVCRRLWESKNPESLFAQKRIRGVLEDYFSEKLSAFPTDLQDTAVALLGLMITADNTRNIISEADLFSRVQKEENIDGAKATKARDLLLGTRLVWRELRNGVYFYMIASEYLAKWIGKKKSERIAERERRLRSHQDEQIRRAQESEQVKSADAGKGEQAKAFDQKTFNARLQTAGAEELAQMFLRPSAEEEKGLRAYFGDERYHQLHSLALVRDRSGRATRAKGNVIVIPGLMDSELSVFTSTNTSGEGELIWLSYWRIAQGKFPWLKLRDDGQRGDYDVRATGIMKRYFGELILTLSQNWNVRTFAFDWRKDLNLAAAELETLLSQWFADDEPFHIVAHDMGGLVARTLIKNFPDRWKSMWDSRSGVAGRLGGRLVMMGTPNHGTFATLQMITGLDPLIKKLSLLDLRHGSSEILEIFQSFPGPYQMLPSPFVSPQNDSFYESSLYKEFKVSQKCLDAAYKQHHRLRDPGDGDDFDRMIYIAGHNQTTPDGVKDYNKLNSLDGYTVTLNGDGRVSHDLGILTDPDGRRITTYVVEDSHANLPCNNRIISALDDLLQTGVTDKLERLAIRRAKYMTGIRERRELKKIADAQAKEEETLRTLVSLLRSSAADSEQTAGASAEERKVEELITRGFLSGKVEEPPAQKIEPKVEAPVIEIGLAYGDICSLQFERGRGRNSYAIDAVAVGHYLGVQLQGSARALDEAISRATPSKAASSEKSLRDDDLILTQYAERGIIEGELGRLFFLNDARVRNGAGSLKAGCVIALAGMGLPGRFGPLELSLMARNLCWSLGRMGKRHLATVLIGAGLGNINVRQAVASWVKGIREAIIGSADDSKRLKRITFVELNPPKVKFIQDAIQSAIVNERSRFESGSNDELRIVYQELSSDTLKRIEIDEDLVLRRTRQGRTRQARRAKPDPMTQKINLTLEFEGNNYRFGAITATAFLPTREVTLDPSLIIAANDELVKARTLERQLERGRFIEKLLIPDDLRSALYGNEPLVLLVDAATARISWEAVAQPDDENQFKGGRPAGGSAQKLEYLDSFLGTSRGLTRQLLLMFKLPPEPPPPPRRVLRVLVVADPAEDARMPGANAEGVEIASLFESFNTVYATELARNRVEVVRLLGPLEATRTNVLRELMVRNYDIIHFAGFCVYDANDPSSSGWLFGHNERLASKELGRLDRIPGFVFSNANEAGLTPDSAELRSAGLAPSLAESFLSRGVSNFICAAWPVDDVTAQRFARTLYAGMLGLKAKEQGSGYERSEQKPIYAAMLDARLAIAATHEGERSWGAYQHYGSPNYRFFSPETTRRLANSTAKAAKSPSGARKRSTKSSRPTKSRAKKAR